MHKQIVPRNSKTLACPVEVVMPSEDLVVRIVNERIAEILSEAATADLQPFFERPEVAEVMRRAQHVIERRKFVWRFEKHGCLVCHRKDTRHAGLSMCPACLSRTREQLNSVKREHAADATTETFHDSLLLAREALVPSVENLARKRAGK